MTDTVLEQGRRICARLALERFLETMAELGYDRAAAVALLKEESV